MIPELMFYHYLPIFSFVIHSDFPIHIEEKCDYGIRIAPIG